MASKEWMDQGVEQRKLILRFVKAYVKKHGYSPSMDEIAEQLGYASKTTARYHVRILVDQGKLAYTPGIYRSIRPL